MNTEEGPEEGAVERRVVLVTGAGTGIGRETARAFAARGARVVAVGRRPEPLTETAAAHPGLIRPLIADITGPDAPEAIVARTLERYGRLDVLVNNAGIVRGGRGAGGQDAGGQGAAGQGAGGQGAAGRDAGGQGAAGRDAGGQGAAGRDAPGQGVGGYDRAGVEALLATNLVAPVLLGQAAVPALAESRGVVVNVSTAIGQRGWPSNAVYAASKAALETVTRSWAVELAPRGIRVVAVAPGAIDTPIGEHAAFDPGQRAAVRAWQLAHTPLGRIGRPAEVAWVIVQLAAPQASFVTGVVLSVDGGALVG